MVRRQRGAGLDPGTPAGSGEPALAAEAPRTASAAGLPVLADGAGRRGNRSRAAAWLVVGCYLVCAVVVTGRLWIDPASRMQAGDTGDVDLFAWFMRYAATAVSHGRLPALFTTMMNAPQGVNLMWNTAFLLPGVLLSPLTLLAGAQVSLTVALTLGFAGSAASLFWVLRRWGASVGAAALGGAVYGFSPALVVSGAGHYHLQFAVLPPLIIHAVARLAAGRVTGRGRVIRAGAWVGLLCAAQIFIGEELLVYTVVASAILVVALAASRPRAVLGRVLGALPALAAAVVVFLVLDGYALREQFAGPLAQHSKLLTSLTGNLGWFVVPSSSVLFHTQGSIAEAIAISHGQGSAEYVDYLGWPLIGVLVIAAVVFWRDMRVRVAAVLWAVLELCALGGGKLHIIGNVRLSGRFLPWHWVQGLPGLAQVLTWRFAILADGAAAMILVFALDLALAAMSRADGRQGWRSWQGWQGWQGWRGWSSRGALGAVAVLAVLPLIPLPYKVTPTSPVPAGWQATFSALRLPSDAPVLVLPFPSGADSQVLRWQADSGEPQATIGGYFLGPGRTGQASFYFQNGTPTTEVADYLNGVAHGMHPREPSVAEIRSVVGGTWRTGAIVAVTSPRSPITRLLTGLFGRPATHIGGVLGWRLRQ